MGVGSVREYPLLTITLKYKIMLFYSSQSHAPSYIIFIFCSDANFTQSIVVKPATIHNVLLNAHIYCVLLNTSFTCRANEHFISCYDLK